MSLWSRIGRLLNPLAWDDEVADIGNKVDKYVEPVIHAPTSITENLDGIVMPILKNVWDAGVNAVRGDDKVASNNSPQVPKGIPAKPNKREIG